jgi:hypothetical protein
MIDALVEEQPFDIEDQEPFEEVPDNVIHPFVRLVKGWTTVGSSSRSWRSLDEEVRNASYSSFFLLTA